MLRPSLIAAAGGASVWLLALGTGIGHRLDEAVFAGLLTLGQTRVGPALEAAVHGADLLPYALGTAALVGIALRRRRPRAALGVLAVLGGSAVTTQILKPLLAVERNSAMLASQLPASWPSGHTTAAVAMALCAVLVAPARLRPAVAAVAGTWAAAVVIGTVALGWHYPSDALGGIAVAAAWAFAVFPPRRARVALGAPATCAAVLACGAAMTTVAFAARPAAAFGFVANYTLASLAVPLLFAAALAVVAAFAATATPSAQR